MTKKLTNLQYVLLNCGLVIAYFLLLILDIYLIVSHILTTDDLFLILISAFFFIIPFISLFAPKRMHHTLYRLGVKIHKKSWLVPEYEFDSYKKYKNLIVISLVIANILMLIELFSKFWAIY